VLPSTTDLRKDMGDPVPKANVLVVDHFEPWRSKIREILKARPEWTIVSEACDGPEAVQKATELQPDIILLDLGLPTLGVRRARYVLKFNAETELVDAISAALGDC
jgi:DNA-binding NarL/FixJ family response regulator